MKKAVNNIDIETDQLKKIGASLRKLRLEKGYTNYEYLAHDLGMSRSHYGRYEQGQNMTLLTFFKILNFHKISLIEFTNNYLG